MKIKSVSASLALATVFCVTACSNSDNNTAATPIVTIPTPPPAPTPTTPKTIRLVEKSRFKANKYDLGAAEIPAFDAASKRVFVVNGADKTVDVISLADITAPTKVGTLNLTTLGAGANSVSVKNGIVAVAIEASPKTNPGKLGLYRASDLTLLGSADVGALPDMLTFTADGKTVLVANEGEPSSYGAADSIDPEGSVSVVDVSNPAAPVVRTAGFAAFNSQAAALRARGVRLFAPNASVAQDVEPEYIAISPDGRSAMVSLQEANAFAKLDIATATITDILPLGLKDHSVTGRGLDPSDRDTSVNAGINIANWPVMGMYMPDTIASYSAGGKAFYVTANEGDARDYTGLTEEVRVGASSYVLDPTVFPNAADLKAAANLGRLTVSSKTGDTDGDGDFDQIHVFGGRSFSIFDDAGALVFDSGDDLERRLAALSSTLKFNPGSTNNTQDDRSDNKGAEPEALSVFTLGTKTFAAIGLERQGGIFTYDITSPTAPVFMAYVTNRKFVVTDLKADVETGGASDGDLAPEGIVFVAAADSPSAKPLLIVANETSGTTTVYEIELQF